MYYQVVKRAKPDLNPIPGATPEPGHVIPISGMYYSDKECVDQEFGENDEENDYLIVQYDDKGFFKPIYIWDKGRDPDLNDEDDEGIEARWVAV